MQQKQTTENIEDNEDKEEEINNKMQREGEIKPKNKQTKQLQHIK